MDEDDNVTKADLSFSEKLRLYFENYPGHCCDVSFVVGTGEKKEVVESSRIILEIVCPEFKKIFDEKWGQAVALFRVPVSRDIEILFPDVDPKAFKLFLKLLLLDNISIKALKDLEDLEVAPFTIWNVIELCRHFKMFKLQNNLQIIGLETLTGSGFSSFAATEEFLHLSKADLNTILLCEELDANETEICNASLRWAEKRCSKRGIKNTGRNIREILGDSLFRIRFPTMTAKEFTSNLRLRSILTEKEQLEILRFISTSDDPLKNDENSLAFDKRKRGGKLLTKMELVKEFTLANCPLLLCNGVQLAFALKVDQEIELKSIGFFGPLDSDSFYDVTVEIQTQKNAEKSLSISKLKERVFAKKNEIFHVFFNKPMKAAYNNNNWNEEYYIVHFSLKGPSTQFVQIPNEYKEFLTESNVRIVFYKCCRSQNFPLAEICFKKC